MHRWSSGSEDGEAYCTRIAALLDAKLSFEADNDHEGQGAGKRGGATKSHHHHQYTSFYVDSCNEDEEDLIDFSTDIHRCEVLNVSSPTSCPRPATLTIPLTPPTTNGVSACIDNGSRECCDDDDGWNSDPEGMPPLCAPSVSTSKFNFTFLQMVIFL